MQPLIIGIDPGTGVKSPLGVVAFDPTTLVIHFMEEGTSKNKELRLRLQDVLESYRRALATFAPEVSTVFIEQFVMRGKGGETLQRLIGAALFMTPKEARVIEVNNKQVKLIVAKTGDADKLEVARGVQRFFKSNKVSEGLIKGLIQNEKWDLLDAFAIAIAGLALNPTKKS